MDKLLAIKLLERAVEWSGWGLLSATGAAAHYLYISLHDAHPFSAGKLFIHMLLAFWMGVVYASWVWPGNEVPAGALMVLGYCSQHIFQFAEDNAARLLSMKLKKLLNIVGDTGGRE